MTNTTFIETSAHKRFVEFARTVRKDRTIGLCYGPAGVGKTLSARRYAKWDIAEPLLESWGPRDPSDEKVYAALARSRTVFYTPPVASAFAALRKDLNQLRNRVEACIDQALDPRSAQPTRPREGHTELIIVDEAERLTNSALEYLRDQFDRAEIGLILIGMPGIEKRMSRYPQLYSRIGFAHPYPPLSRDEMAMLMQKGNEANKAQGIPEVDFFEQLDWNNDGVVSMEESKDWFAAMAKFLQGSTTKAAMNFGKTAQKVL